MYLNIQRKENMILKRKNNNKSYDENMNILHENIDVRSKYGLTLITLEYFFLIN